jgi:hypothetical protein
MNTFVITIFVSALATSTLADILGPPPPIAERKVVRWELEMADGDDCSSRNLMLKITNKEELNRNKDSRGFRAVRTCDITIPNFAEGRRAGALITEYSTSECRLKFNNDKKLPYYQLKSDSGNNYCLDDIALYDHDEEEFSTHNPITIRGTKMDNWNPLFHASNMVTVNDQLQALTCPSEGQGCPINDLAAAATKRTETMYCMFNLNCAYVSSAVPAEQNNGIVCMENTFGSFDNYDYCCTSGDYGPNMPEC